jgi:flavin reductase (DIM6/NTAB) family NADH-FMN oxidoreductase RutF
VERSTFDDVVASTDPAMVVVTVAAAGGEVDGCLVGFHSQCSIDPPRYAVWLSRANRTFELAEEATHLAVHVLGVEDRDLAALFGGESGDEVDKLAAVTWVPGPGGTPMLTRVPRCFAGRIVASVDVDADHHCIVLEPVEASAGDGAVLRLEDVTDVEPGHAADERR